MNQDNIHSVSIFDLVQMRIALEQIKDPSEKIINAIATLDDHIQTFTSSLQKGH